MATTRAYTFNTGSTINGTEQKGNVAIQIGNVNFQDGHEWIAGPDESLGYVICSPTNSIVRKKIALYLNASNSNSYPGTGDVWYDLSGNDNHCNFNNTPTYNSTYFTFNGTSHYGTIINNSTLDFSEGQTLIIWMKHSFTSGRRNPWDQAYGGYGTWTHENGSNINQYFGNAGSNTAPYVGYNSNTTNRNVWNCMCSVRSLSEHRWYKNGSLVTGTDKSNPYGKLTYTSANIKIGYGYAGYWEGDIGIVLVYKNALNATEVLQNYNAQKSIFGL